MHEADVRALVWKKGGTFKTIAERSGLHRSTVSAACVRPQPSGNRAIASFLDKTVHELWPEWFDPQGNRRTSRDSKAIDSSSVGHRQKAEAV